MTFAVFKGHKRTKHSTMPNAAVFYKKVILAHVFFFSSKGGHIHFSTSLKNLIRKVKVPLLYSVF